MILVLQLDEVNDVFVDQVITLGVDVVNRSAADADYTSNKLLIDHVPRTGVGRVNIRQMKPIMLQKATSTT